MWESHAQGSGSAPYRLNGASSLPRSPRGNNPAPKPRPDGATRRRGCLINEGSEMPDKYITLNGHLYRLVEDGGSERLTAAQIHERTGKSIHAINAAMKEGRLAYSVPNGCKRPRMASWQAVAEWMGWE